jgi:hypothetical protein
VRNQRRSGQHIRHWGDVVRFQDGTRDMLKLRSIGIRDYSVFEGGQRIGRIRFAGERMPGVWLWNVVTLPGADLEGVWRRCHDVGGFRSSETALTGGLPMGSSTDLDTAKADFKAAWEALKARTSPSLLAAACKDLNIRDDG